MHGILVEAVSTTPRGVTTASSCICYTPSENFAICCHHSSARRLFAFSALPVINFTATASPALQEQAETARALTRGKVQIGGGTNEVSQAAKLGIP